MPPTRSSDTNAHRRHRDDEPRDQRRDTERGEARRRGDSSPSRRLSGTAAVERAKGHLVELTGQPCESVSSLGRTPEGWRVVLEVVEVERVPRTTDILASYMVDLDEQGELVNYERVARYYRNQVSGGEA